MDDTDSQIKEFLDKGGKIEKIASDDTAAAKRPKLSRQEVLDSMKRRGNCALETKRAKDKLKEKKV